MVKYSSLWQFSKKQNMEKWKTFFYYYNFFYLLFIYYFISTKVWHLALYIWNCFMIDKIFCCEINHTFHSTCVSRYIHYCKKKLRTFLMFFFLVELRFILLILYKIFFFTLEKCNFACFTCKYSRFKIQVHHKIYKTDYSYFLEIFFFFLLFKILL